MHEDNSGDKMEKKGIHQAEGELLGAASQEDKPVADVEWVTVARDLDPIQAEVLKGDLMTAGIPVVIEGSRLDTFPIYPKVDNAIQVPKRWLEDAQAIVNDFLAGLEMEDIDTCSNCGAEVPPEATSCPNCGEPFTDEVSEDSEEAEGEKSDEDGGEPE